MQHQRLASLPFSLQITSSPTCGMVGKVGKKNYLRLTGINQFTTYHTKHSPHPSGVRVLQTNKACRQGYFSFPSPSPVAHFSTSRLLPLQIFPCSNPPKLPNPRWRPNTKCAPVPITCLYCRLAENKVANFQEPPRN